MTMTDHWIELPIPRDWPARSRRIFLSFAATVGGDPTAEPPVRDGDHGGLSAACLVLSDLARQGWEVRVAQRRVRVHPPTAAPDAAAEKERVRTQELLKRDEQLGQPSVRRFVADMERPKEHLGSFVSIFNLMRDGRDLATKLEALATGATGAPAFRQAIDPYIQVVTNGKRCEHTGLRLLDVWRYFRHTWTNQYTSTPGRTLPLLIRDRAAPFHPVIGIAALGSPIVQIRERDQWIGWQPQDFLAHLDAAPQLRWARWIMRRLEEGVQALYLDDLVEDGLYWPTLWDSPADDAIVKLRNDAELRRRDHHRYARRSDFKSMAGSSDERVWRARAESDLFRSKRCLALADLLRARQALVPHLAPVPTRRGLSAALRDPAARRAIADVLRRAKAEAVGTEIADLTVCGAIPPYNALVAGKLVSMLAVSPAVVRMYRERYSDYASEIASSLAGRAVRRRSNLVFVGTTSLYGSNASQYNRLRLARSVLNTSRDITFERLGTSRSFGTSHLSSASVAALVRLAEETRVGARVNSIFGEGVNPKLRKVRAGLDLLGWPSDELLRHRRPRIVYGVSLVDNLLPYLLGLDQEPRYTFRRNAATDVGRVVDWWFARWLQPRVARDDVLTALCQHSIERPVRHGARVQLPNMASDDC